eukprot:gb/GECG01006361.1/.p1 GENE.gb/GECG01006361.1/~~gb/GECG01006361.1/.p1  ORF type:complete len:195 (+),score=13.20 gb/GECG01006361.1/:1-585(+)
MGDPHSFIDILSHDLFLATSSWLLLLVSCILLVLTVRPRWKRKKWIRARTALLRRTPSGPIDYDLEVPEEIPEYMIQEDTAARQAQGASVGQVQETRGPTQPLLDEEGEEEVKPSAPSLANSDELSCSSLPPEYDDSPLAYTCCICYSTIKHIHVLGCGHAFHQKCIVKALKQKEECPHCRQPQTLDDIRGVYG